MKNVKREELIEKVNQLKSFLTNKRKVCKDLTEQEQDINKKILKKIIEVGVFLHESTEIEDISFLDWDGYSFYLSEKKEENFKIDKYIKEIDYILQNQSLE